MASSSLRANSSDILVLALGSFDSILKVIFHLLLIHAVHLDCVRRGEQIPFAQSADSEKPKKKENRSEVLKAVLGVNCSSYVLRAFPLDESEWLGRFSSVNLCEPLDFTWAHNW